jgi:hypothetical protein
MQDLLRMLSKHTFPSLTEQNDLHRIPVEFMDDIKKYPTCCKLTDHNNVALDYICMSFRLSTSH